MALGHAHQTHAHDHHTVSAEADRGPLTVALGLILGLMAAEVVAGFVAHSVALLTDAGHMLADAGALGLSLVAIRLAARPPAGRMTFGLKRAEPLSALVNGIALAVLALVFVIEAAGRIASPRDVEAGLVLAVALGAIPVNLAATVVLARANRASVNVEGAFQHIVTDLYAFVATAIAAVVILTTGFDRADAIAALFVSALMVRAAWSLLRGAGGIFFEASPQGIDPVEVGQALAGAEGVVSVHDLHVWEVTSGFTALSAHVIVGTDDDCHLARLELERLLHDRFAIEHTTLQIEHEPRRILSIE